jgi:hypothetical protein
VSPAQAAGGGNACRFELNCTARRAARRAPAQAPAALRLTVASPCPLPYLPPLFPPKRLIQNLHKRRNKAGERVKAEAALGLMALVRDSR